MARFETDPEPIVKCMQHVLNKLFSVTDKDQAAQLRNLDYAFVGLAMMATYQSKRMSGPEKYKTATQEYGNFRLSFEGLLREKGLKIPSALLVAIELSTVRIFQKGSWQHQNTKLSHLKACYPFWAKLTQKYRSGKQVEEVVEMFNAAVNAVEEAKAEKQSKGRHLLLLF